MFKSLILLVLLLFSVVSKLYSDELHIENNLYELIYYRKRKLSLCYVD